MTYTSESAMVVSFVGAFFNILRFAIDVVTVAAKTEDKKEKELLDGSVGSKGSPSSNVASKGPYSSNGKVRITGLSLLKPKGKTESESLVNNAPGDNRNDEEGGSRMSTTQEEERSYSEKMLSFASCVFQLACFAFFLTMTILVATRTSASDDDDAIFDTVYHAIPLGASTVGVFFGFWMSLRDYKRERFSFPQRLCFVLSTTITMLGCIVIVASPPVASNGPTVIDYVVMSCMIVYWLLAVVESKIFAYPMEKSKEESTKKAHLGRALLLILKPYFWPDATASSALLNRTRAILTWVCVGGSKACSLASPIFLGRASTALAQYDYAECARNAIFYSVFQFSSTFLKECQSLVYLKVAQAAFVQLSEVSFYHLHSLSLDWHLRKKLGEVIRSMDRGILACDTLMKYLFLWMVPAIAECILVCVIFASYFNYLPLALTIFSFVFIYMTWTIVVTLWRKKFRKSVAKSDNDWHDKCTDSLINFETVKYFTAERYEIERFSESVKEYQSGSVNVQASLSFLNISQTLLMQTCLATALVLTSYGVKIRFNCCLDNGCEMNNLIECCSTIGDSCDGLEIGDFVAVLTYTLNLFGPLNFLGSVYNAIVMALVDLRNLSELLAEEPDLKDAPDAIELPKMNADDPDTAIEFDHVSFRYPSQIEGQGLTGVSFKMKRGTTTAIVGTTGAGKTTISRLLFRFYDTIGGAVKVNGVDVRTVTQKSLRDIIGVVPQSASLFNDTIKANILYGRRDATDEELDQAAQSAQLLDFIRSLPEGWETVVGDRGLKLSGGEKQRTAIARCLLKDPPIVVLDEGKSPFTQTHRHTQTQSCDLY
jgi:ABC-type transport system involved in Fe-S cluster assembly, permease and ATPase components